MLGAQLVPVFRRATELQDHDRPFSGTPNYPHEAVGGKGVRMLPGQKVSDQLLLIYYY